ncbi:amino-acid N-acetyltransferase [Vibrio sp. SS-MA-C1-2]|uniref:amino-acid N-acetyltransferase n=1 Tax=Vibrio sp. SS-MA-C1-2 TaxID=2908646 RepID=UPI001F41F152|nr:amino-acid N-acetyltransferase [Vibrio sp. SS-MA-C1-2]UJF18923.1 amino-acid N-acetyltransferase [Vibrio sp. SS-MA-C1-2]
MRLRSTALVKGFRQSTPYLNAHRDKTFIIILDGELTSDSNFSRIINDISILNSLGIRLVLVYGARPQINQNLVRHNHETPYHRGIRVTDSYALELAKQAAGQLQLDITARLSMGLNNTSTAGSQINVISGNFIIAQPLGISDGVDFCHSGRIRRIDIEGINRQLEQQAIVLLGPIASSVTGECFNLTSEEIATQLAIKLKADKIIGFCAEQGVLDHEKQLHSELLPHEAEQLLFQLNQAEYSTTSRFLRGAIAACRAGVPRCHLLSYKIDGAIIQELFSYEGIGTQVVMESAEQVRAANINDVGGILSLIQPLEQQGILVRRSREQLEQEIPKFTIIEKDGLIIGCATLHYFHDEKMAEMACVAVHPDYRDADRGVILLERLRQQAKSQGVHKIFVLTTQTIHWFREQGFQEINVEQLPAQKQQMYNYQRRSKLLALAV